MARVTAQDVGRLAGVHPSTVSRVINRAFQGHSYDPETIRRVQECAAKLGYRPFHAARSLRTGKTMQVGVVVTDIANPFFGELAATIERATRERGYRTMICNTEEDPELQAEHLSELAGRHVDGIILCPSGQAGCDHVVEAQVPLVSIDRPTAIQHVPHVGLNNVLAGQMLGRHLARLGFHRVGVVMPETPYDPTLLERLNGLLTGMGDEGQLVWTECGQAQALRTKVRQRIAQRLAGAKQPPDALVGLTNNSTLAIIEAMHDRQLAIADPIGVAGIDDFSSATILRPAITVVAQPIRQIAVRASNMLIDLIADAASQPQTILLDPLLKTRGSLRDAEAVLKKS